jgi:hypothetical protein
MLTLLLDDFVTWLCESERTVVGRAGAWCSSPLARYLFERTGRLYCVDDSTYGLAVSDVSWALPQWARRFSALLECRSGSEMTGSEAFDVLVSLWMPCERA